MKKQSIILGLAICFFIAAFVTGVLSQTQSPAGTEKTSDRNQPAYMSPQQKQREYEQRMQKTKPQRDRMREEDRKAMAKAKEESIKEVLGANEEQWKIIWPKLKKVRALGGSYKPSLMIGSSGSGGSSGPGGGGASGSFGLGTSGGKEHRKEIIDNQTGSRTQVGWRWARPSDTKKPSEITVGDRIDEELLDLLENKEADEKEIRQKVEALREYREKANKEWAKAMQELREALTFRQEAMLIMMGTLD